MRRSRPSHSTINSHRVSPSLQHRPPAAQIPIAEHVARRGPPNAPKSRFRPLAVFVRRPPAFVARFEAAGIRKPSQLRTHAPQQPPPSAFEGQTGPFRRAARLEEWFHSITRSARTSTETGIVIPNSFATFWFTVSSKRVGCMIGSSPGFAPRAILSRYKTTPWTASSKLSP